MHNQNHSTNPMQHESQPLAQVQENNPPVYKSNPFSIIFDATGKVLEKAPGIFIAWGVAVFGYIFLSFMLQLIPLLFSSTADSVATQQSDLYAQQDTEENPWLYEDQTNYTIEPTESYNDDDFLGATELREDEPINPAAIIGVVALFLFFGILYIAFFVIFGSLFTALISGTTAAAAIGALQGQRVSFGQALSAMASRFGTLYVAILLSMLRIAGGYILLIVPGVRAQFRYGALPVIVMRHRQMGAREAVEYCKKLYNGHLMESAGITMAPSLIPVVSSFQYLFSTIGYAASVEQIEHYNRHNLQKPNAHWLNYLVFIIPVILILLYVLFFVLIFAAINAA